MSEFVIKVDELGKCYRIRHEDQQRERYATLRDSLARKAKSLLNPRSVFRNSQSSIEDFWAIKGVSFEVKEGEVVGIIGRNGAGKSTLLKILSRITEPTKGRITLRGRVASLLEVGTGFHPELTGRENVYLNGAVLGMTRTEIRSKFDEIVSFAEVEKFLDTPVKRYSSGMQMRLAFAVAAHLEPEILIVDEVLAVGDAEFQRRCLGKMNEVCESGRTVIFVSHNMQAVRQLCERAIWLERGQVRAMGRSDEMVEQYLTAERKSDSIAQINAEIAGAPADSVFRLRHVDILQDGVSGTQLITGKPVEVRLTYDVLQDTHGLHIYFLLCDMDGTLIFESLHNGADEENLPLVRSGSYVSTATIPANFLAGRIYELQIQAAIQSVRAFFRKPPSISLHVHHAGIVNRAYAGYDTPGKLAPLIQWQTVPARDGS
jgi:lipopolysaccharide transport system ATP-binding protein